MRKGPWCQKLKLDAIQKINETLSSSTNEIIQYLGIAADEPKRIKTHEKRPDIKLPLVELGWEEDLCGLWCKYSDLLAPTYSSGQRDGCWFCHNQGVGQLRLLRRNYPDLWKKMMTWDNDSPETFHSDGKTVHLYDLRFHAEDLSLVPADCKFRWDMLNSKVRRACALDGMKQSLLNLLEVSP